MSKKQFLETIHNYIFKILTPKDEIKFHLISTANINKARKLFAEESKTWEEGWALIAIYREV